MPCAYMILKRSCLFFFHARMAHHGTGDVESSVRDRPIPISPQKTVNIYAVLGLVRKQTGRHRSNDSNAVDIDIMKAFLQITAWFLIIDVMILSYLNDRGERGTNRGPRVRIRMVLDGSLCHCSYPGSTMPGEREASHRPPIRSLPTSGCWLYRDHSDE